MNPQLPPTVNFHFWRPCNMKCRFCFATFEDTREQLPKGHLPQPDGLALIDALADAGGVEKLTFVGGEPTLCPWLPELIERANEHGLVTMVVSNGWALRDNLDRIAGADWLALSVDSIDPEVNRRSGRAVRETSLSLTDLLDIASRTKAAGVRLKLNTVVHAMNHHEDLREFVTALAPARWKLFQVLPMAGQNDEHIAEFAITEAEFAAYVDRHADLVDRGIVVVPERNEQMRGSYAMIDPRGCFFDNVEGRLRYSQPILEVGVLAAWRAIEFSHERFGERGGRYDFGNKLVSPPTKR